MFRNVEKKESNVALKYLSPMSKKFVKSVTLVNFVSEKPICYKFVLKRILNKRILVFGTFKRQFLKALKKFPHYKYDFFSMDFFGRQN